MLKKNQPLLFKYKIQQRKKKRNKQRKKHLKRFILCFLKFYVFLNLKAKLNHNHEVL